MQVQHPPVPPFQVAAVSGEVEHLRLHDPPTPPSTSGGDKVSHHAAKPATQQPGSLATPTPPKCPVTNPRTDDDAAHKVQPAHVQLSWAYTDSYCTTSNTTYSPSRVRRWNTRAEAGGGQAGRPEHVGNCQRAPPRYPTWKQAAHTHEPGTETMPRINF